MWTELIVCVVISVVGCWFVLSTMSSGLGLMCCMFGRLAGWCLGLCSCVVRVANFSAVACKAEMSTPDV